MRMATRELVQNRNVGQEGSAARSYAPLVKEETRTFYETAVLRAVERITSSLDGALELSAIAKDAALSPFHFHRVFRGMVGETPLALHRRLRMERAAERLCVDSKPVIEIAFTAGYETHEAFTRAFRASYGTSPSVFRQRAIDARNACHGLPTDLPTTCRLHVHAGVVDVGSLVLIYAGDTPMNVEIETLPTRRLATVRHVGPYQTIGEAFHRLGTLAVAHGLYARVEPAMLALYHDDPDTTPTDELRSDAALVVRDDMALPSEVTEATLQGGPYAKMTYRGAYSGLGDAWARLMGVWLPRSGCRVGNGPSYEVYVTDPRTTPADELQTDLYLRLSDSRVRR